MATFKKLLVTYRRKTSTSARVFRFEVPLLKLKHEKFELSVSSIPVDQLDIESDIQDFDAVTAFAYVRQIYTPELVSKIYADRISFEDDFEACVQRELGTVDVETGGWQDLEKIDGVSTALAKALHSAGLQTIQAVAEAELDALEAIRGIGPSSAILIKRSARTFIDALQED